MMTHRTLRWCLVSALLLSSLATACGEDDANETANITDNNGTTGGATSNATTGDTTPTSNTTTGGTTGGTTGETTTGPPPPPPPMRLTVTLDPALPIYRPGLKPLPVATIYDAAGELMESEQVAWSIEPPEAAQALENGRWEMLAEGDLVITGCTTTPGADGDPVCGSRDILVDAGAPRITLSSPQPGAELLAEESQSIVVSGTVTDTNGELTLFVNGDEVELSDAGEFTTEVTPVFGINHIELTATDGRQPIAAETAVDVLWSRDYLPVPEPTEANNTTRALLDGGIELRLGQQFLDDGEPLRIGAEDTEVTARDLAGIVELLLMELDITSQIPNPLADSDEISLAVTSIDVIDPVVSVDVVDGGLELFIRLSNLQVNTEGFFNFEGQELNLNGGIRASAAAYSRVRVEKANPEQELTVEIETLELAIEDAEGYFVSSEANAVFALAESFLRDLLEDTLVDALESSFLDAIPETLIDVIGELEQILANQQFDLDIDLLPPVALKLDGRLNRLETHLRSDLTAILDAEVSTDQPEVISDSRGIALSVAAGTAPPFFSSSRIQLGARMALINGLLHTLWRAGLFEIDAYTILPENLSFLLQSATLSARMPPLVTAARPDQSDRSLLVTLGQVEFTADFGLQQDVYGMLIRTSADVVFEDNALVLSINAEPNLVIWPISTTGDTVMFEPEALKILIEAEVWPLLADALAENLSIPLPAFDLGSLGDLAPSLSNFAPTLVEARPITIREGYLIFDGGLEGSVPVGGF